MAQGNRCGKNASAGTACEASPDCFEPLTFWVVQLFGFSFLFSALLFFSLLSVCATCARQVLYDCFTQQPLRF
jgi:hypothetical protein